MSIPIAMSQTTPPTPTRLLPFVSKPSLLLVIAAVALAIGLPHHLALRQLRQNLARAQAELTNENARLMDAATVLDRLHEQVSQQRRQREKALASVAKAEQQLASVNPEAKWSLPPSVWPEWNSGSPYVWLRKEMLPMFPVPAFGKDGTLSSEVAAVLTVNPETQNRLNERLRQILTRYQAMEVANAEPVDQPVEGITTDGPVMTIRVSPLGERGAEFRQEFERTLRNELGEQRAELLTQCAVPWLAAQFSAAGQEPTVISVVRHQDHTYNVSIKSSAGWLSVGGIPHIDDYVPAHLLPFFSNLTAAASP